MRYAILGVLTIAVTAVLQMRLSLHAQAPAAIAFEVASLKANTSGSPNSSINAPPNGRFTAVNVSARSLIENAFRLRSDHLIGGPGWLVSERFDVAAKAADGTPTNLLPVMLQVLLADRFKLQVHRETRDQPVYVLMLARDDGRLGPKLIRSVLNCPEPGRGAPAGTAAATPAASSDCGVNTSVSRAGGTIKGGGRSIARLVETLSSQLDRPVIDRTGLSGNFDFDLQFSNENLTANGTASEGPTIFTAMQEQLGLKVERDRAPGEFIVIDSVERPLPD